MLKPASIGSRSLDNRLRRRRPAAQFGGRHEDRTRDRAVRVCLVLILRALHSGFVALLVGRANVGALDCDRPLVREVRRLFRPGLRRAIVAVDEDKHLFLTLVDDVVVRVEEARPAVMVETTEEVALVVKVVVVDSRRVLHAALRTQGVHAAAVVKRAAPNDTDCKLKAGSETFACACKDETHMW